MTDLVSVRRALVSVSDKSGLIPFVRALAAHGVEIVSTGGTAVAIASGGIPVRSIDDLTGFPEMLSGRVKTLHPKVHGGLLGLREDASHQEQMRRHGIEPIDLVCVNLYPFEQTVQRGASHEEAIENIDIGGPSMIRSAAKNHSHVCVVTSPAQYERVRSELETHAGRTSLALRTQLAAEAFDRTFRYDAAIASFLQPRPTGGLPNLLSQSFVKAEDLRYGENPHQSAALYRSLTPGSTGAPSGTLAFAEQLHGRDLGYNNILDASAALELAWALGRCEPGRRAIGAAIVKHTNPCGAAIAASADEAVRLALVGDPLAAYGGILAMNDELDEDAAACLTEKSVFLEVIVAPSYSPGALDVLRAKSANLRILACGRPSGESHTEALIEARTIPAGLLVQQHDAHLTARAGLVHAAGPAPTTSQMDAAMFLEPVARSLLSNAVAIGGAAGGSATGLRLFGAGAGQMDRVTACRIAVEKAGAHARGAAVFSDAFFPFADGPRLLADAGVATLVHPGGSKRDAETFDLCNARGITCLTTGVRHFRH